jgi:PTH2 family peptidyl-tRNA hydrolase
MKQVIVMRTDLGMGKGKLCAQACHASTMCAVKTHDEQPIKYVKWLLNDLYRKVVLKVDSAEEIQRIAREADAAGVICFVVMDAGLTQIEAGSVTCIGLGPDENEKLDKIVGGLKLL